MKHAYPNPLQIAGARSSRRWHTLFSTSLLLLGAAGIAAAADNMPDQLQELANQHHFEISGFDQLASSPARRTSGSLRDQIRLLLENYNYILVGTADGGIGRIIVMGGKQALPEPPPKTAGPGQAEASTDAEETVLATRRQDLHHLVDAILVGPSGNRLSLALTIDTGASFVVLPRSIGEQLGFVVGELDKRQVKTANGTAEAVVSTIPQVLLGDASVADAQVAFIDDEQLGDSALLGMSVLGHFYITLDDKNNQLTLRKK